MAIPLHAGEYKSPNTPPVFVTGADAKKAPKNRVNINVWKSFATALPKLKQIDIAMGTSTATRLPKTSLRGAHSKGPRPNPNKKSVVPKMETWLET